MLILRVLGEKEQKLGMADVDIQSKQEDTSETFWSRFTALIGSRPKEAPRRKIYIIANPVAGKDQPVLKTLNDAMHAAGVDWTLSVTKNPGDGQALAQQAVKDGADVVAVYGGDGTLMEVANGLLGSQVPMAILPAGTANVLAVELGIPMDLAAACALAVDSNAAIRQVDMFRIGERCYLLKAGTGLNAAAVEATDQQMKERLGVLAYALSSLQALGGAPSARYHLSLDKEQVEMEGMVCLIANAGAIAAPMNISLAPNVSMTDGLLDLFLLRKIDLPSLLSVAVSVVGGTDSADALLHWQARKIEVIAEPSQPVQADGEVLGQTPFTAIIVSKAARIIVPQVGNTDAKDTSSGQAAP